MNYKEMTDRELLSAYQTLFHDAELSKELMARGFVPKTRRYAYANGTMGYAPYVLKNGKKVLG